MSNNQSKQLVHGAMMIALFTIILAIAYFIPPIALIVILFSPLPIAWYSATYERVHAIWVTIAGLILTFIIGGLLLLPTAIMFGLAGLVMGEALRLKKSKVYLLISTSITFLFSAAIVYIVSVKVFNIDFIRESLDSVKKMYIDAMEMSEKVSGQAAAISTEDLNLVFDSMNTVIPGAVIILCGLAGFAVVAINLPLLKRFKIEVPTFQKFSMMRLPKAVLWYYLVVLIISMFVRPEAGSVLYVITLNFSMIIWVLLTLQGVSFFYFVIEEKKLPSFLKVLAAIFSMPFYSFVLLIGVLDLGFNIRTFITTKKNV